MNTKRLNIFFLILLAPLLLPCLTHAESSKSGIVIFGDSLSDTGNRYYETGFATTPPYSELLDYFLVPDGPYTRGGLHFSNGATWIEQLAGPTGQSGYVGPALRNQGKASNYAYGGARAREGFVIIPNNNQHLPIQVSNFLADVNHSAPSEALYIIFIGGNDIFDAVYALTYDPTGGWSAIVISQAIESVVTQIMTLKAAGAQKFVVLNAPDLGATPAIKLADSRFSPWPGALIAAATAYSQAYNAGLMAYLGSVPGIKIIDVYSVVNDIVTNPQNFGLINGTDACVMPEQPPYVCKKPDDYVFWDGIHPTKKVHAILADVVANALAN